MAKSNRSSSTTRTARTAGARAAAKSKGPARGRPAAADAPEPAIEATELGGAVRSSARSARAKTVAAGEERAPRKAAPRRAASRKASPGAKAKKQQVAAGTANGKALVIVESPAKSRTLTKFLGRGFQVLASNGHIMDLPKSKLGVDIDNDFEPEYVPIQGKNQALAKIREAAQHADRIFLAPDPDREGEAIAWHLAEALRRHKRPLQRLTFNEITERAVKQALEQPRSIDMNLVYAQQARRVLDRLVGYKVSPFLWKTMYYGLSAGRVQSVALRMICEREDAIDAFVPEEYWTIEADYEPAEDVAAGGEATRSFTTRLVRVGTEDLEQGQIRGEGAADRAGALGEELRRAQAKVSSVQTKPTQVHPKPPFITSTLQQTAFNRYGFQAQRTMKIAQHLYEGVSLGPEGSVGLITYMRTDAPRLAGEAIGEIRGWLEQQLGADYVPESPRQYRSKKGAQEAHEAIRPTSVARTPDAVRRFLTEEQHKLYSLIWTRAVASQAASAEYLATTIEVEAGRLGLKATGRVLKFAGFQKLYGIDEEDDERDRSLPMLEAETALAIARVSLGKATEPEEGETPAQAEPTGPVRPAQHFTQPPPRFTEASLVRALEEENIGRPSTYATIVSTITNRKYVERDKGRLTPTDLGRTVSRLLVDTFPDVFDVGFTANMEEELDGIEEGSQEWHRVVRDFWNPLSKDLAQAEKEVKHHKQRIEEPTEIECPTCGRMLVRKFGRRGPFLACPGYPECKYTRPVDDSELPTPVEGECPLCGSALVARNGPYGRFIACVRRPECNYTKKMTLGIPCPQCGQGEITERRTKTGKVFYGCTRYPECDFAVWDRPILTPCPSCGAPFLVEKETRKGRILRCVRCKTTLQPETLSA